MTYPVTVRANNPSIAYHVPSDSPVMSTAFVAWALEHGLDEVPNDNWNFVDRPDNDSYFTVTWYFDNPDHAVLFKLAWV